MNNKIHKIDSSQTNPAPIKTTFGPATCGIEFDESPSIFAVELTPTGAGGTVNTPNRVYLMPTYRNNGAPTSGTTGTGAGVMGPGNFLYDYTNNNVYMNTGTQASPTWTLFPVPGGALTSLLEFTAADTLTAHSGGGQTSALALTKQFNTITTVAAAADSVRLPASVAGLEITLVNVGANPMQVFGAGTDTVDSVATATGVSQMANSVVQYVCTTAGNWNSQGLAEGFSPTGLATNSFTATTTAHSGGGQASAVALTSQMNRVSTVAAQGDSVKLPAATVGLEIIVLNRGANAMQVFGAGTDTINGIVTTTGVSQGVGCTALYTCNVAGNWEVPISSLVGATPVALTTNGAIPPHVAHVYAITKAGVLAETLAAPTATTDDGLEITVFSTTANAHTITATGLLKTGSAFVNVATFNAQAGASLTLLAYNALWYVIAANGVSFS